MTTVLDRPTTTMLNRPLLGVAVLMVATAVVTTVLALVAPVESVGTNGWIKPLQFLISIAIYAVTIAWLLTLLPPRRARLGRGIAWVVVVGMVVKMIAIVGAAAVGTTGHLNVSTPLHTAVWASMGTAIAAVWLVIVVLAVLMWRASDDPARRLAIRAGLIIGLAGMAVAFLMTSPMAEQLDSFSGIAVAHAVGIADGGAGLPLLGWSTTGGDLRVPHFVGMHALQVLPLLAFGLEAVRRRVPALEGRGTRFRVVAIALAGYAAVVVLLTLQALAGVPVTSTFGWRPGPDPAWVDHRASAARRGVNPAGPP